MQSLHLEDAVGEQVRQHNAKRVAAAPETSERKIMMMIMIHMR